MGINIRTKGRTGEQEIAEVLNLIVLTVLTVLNLPTPAKPIIQRNQNQSAVGGNDLINTFGLSIEVKRQETLAINSWWKQCEDSANRNNEIPVLIFRQNRKPWRVVLNTNIPVPDSNKFIPVRSEIDWESFQFWFHCHVETQLRNGYEPKI